MNQSEEYVEVTVDLLQYDDITILHSVVEGGGVDHTSRPSSSSATQNAAVVDDESDPAFAARAMRRQQALQDRTRSGAHKTVKGFRFISNGDINDWKDVERNFNKLAIDGFLHRADFAQCIGMRDSKEFALEIYDAISRRQKLIVEKISRDELFEYWSQITDQSFNSRLQIFLDMVDKNGDGIITEREIEEIILLSASANKLSRLKEEAELYAAFVMDELDPECLGYIETIAAAIVIGIILHAGTHLACDFPRLISTDGNSYDLKMSKYFGENKPRYIDLVRGVEGVTGVIMVICMAIAFTLATTWFRRNLGKLPKPLNKLTGFNAFCIRITSLLLSTFCCSSMDGSFIW